MSNERKTCLPKASGCWGKQRREPTDGVHPTHVLGWRVAGGGHLTMSPGWGSRTACRGRQLRTKNEWEKGQGIGEKAIPDASKAAQGTN